MTTATTTQQAGSPTAIPRLPREARSIIVTLLVAAFVVILNETIMGVALPRLMVDLGITARTVQWLTTAFMLTMAVVIPTTGFLLQRVSTRTVFMLAMGLFCTGTLLAAVSPGFWLLLPGPGRSGLGHGDDDPAADDHGAHAGADRTARCGDGQHQHRHLGRTGHRPDGVRPDPAVPVLAVHVRPGAAGGAGGDDLRIPATGQRRAARESEARHLLGAAVRAGVRRHRLRAQPARTGLVRSRPSLSASSRLGVVCLLVFGWRQLRLARSGSPLLDLRAFRYPMFSLSLTLLCLAMLSLFGMVILLPIYLQTVRGIGSLVDRPDPAPGRAVDGTARADRRKVVRPVRSEGLTILGATLLGLTMWQLSLVGPDTPIWMLVGLHVVLSRRPGLPVHALLHHRAEPAAAVSLLPRQRDPGHPAAGGRRRRNRLAGRDHGGQQPQADSGRACRSSRR